MMISRSGGLAVILLAVALTGCNSARFASMDTQRSPEPLMPAPSGEVTNDPLPPPTDSDFPEAPTTDTAALDPTLQPQQPPENAPDVTAGGVAGVWNATVSGQGCRIATPQTKFGQGFRAGPLRCPAPLDGVKSWNVEGKQLALYDESGGVLARLYSSGAERFDGQTTSGQPISLSR